MKPRHRHLPMLSAPSRQSGMTLILALLVILLLASLLISFLGRSRSVRRSGALHRDGAQARQLAENGVQLVLSRIQDTTRVGPGEVWVSQPGALHVYGLNGDLARIRKLYSAPQEIVTDPGALASDLPASGWADRPHQWVDLNAPWSRNGIVRFPIVDPRLSVSDNPPEGFAYREGVEGVVTPEGQPEPDDLRLPMPVQWLYQLSNGDFVTPTSVDAAGVVTLPVPEGEEIIGRVAFWSDDESTKINLNTAAGGAFWDTPRLNSAYERSLATSQPVQGEFQRYPGHPATVDLRTVFPWLDDEALYALAPRVRPGGSANGTVETTADSLPPPIVPDADPLHITPAEARYQPDRTPLADAATLERLRQGAFLLTTTSRAPELNLFGHPRISMWPLSTQMGDRSPLDRTLAMSSSIQAAGTLAPYYFQREEALSPTHDYEAIPRNRQLLAYLRAATSTAIPGFGGDFATKYTGPVRDQILTQIFDYIRGATNLKDPLGKRYADPIIHSGSGSYQTDPGEGQVAPIYIEEWGTQGFGRFFTVSEAFLWLTWQGQGDNTNTPANDAIPATAPSFPLPATPPPDDHTQLQAIFALQFAGPAAGYSELAPSITVRIRGLEALQINGTPMGFPADGSVVVAQTRQNPLGAIYDLRGMVQGKRFTRDANAPDRFPFYSDIIAVRNRVAGESSIPLSRISALNEDGEEIATTRITISLYSGEEVDAERLVQEIDLDLPIAAFRPPTPPVVIAPENKHNNAEVSRRWGTGAADDKGNPRADRFMSGSYGPGGYIDRNDVLRSMTSASGDHRISAGLRNVPPSFFIPHRGWRGNDANAWRGTANNVATLLTNLGYNGYANTYAGKLSADQPDYGSGEARVAIGPHIQGKPTNALSWDFDTGMARQNNGAFINKPDEGSLGTANKGSYYGGEETAKAQLDDTMFTPNRQIPSAGMLGSLPSGINPSNPSASTHWQTLHFRPDPVNHPGNAAPADHLLLDLFRMPVVEPYAISEPFSTAGKVNMNTRLAPFDYITRESALRAALKGERLLAFKPEDAGLYKGYGSNTSPNMRLSLDLEETLKGFRARYDSGKLFLSPTEICTLYLVPQGQTLAGMPAFWQEHSFTGDNLRERPYANLLPKLTTRSNSYSIHLIAQAVKKSPGSPRNQFGARGDRVVSEWAGTFVVERFLDPNDPRLVDIAARDFTLNDPPWDAPEHRPDRLYQTRILYVREWR